MLCRDFLCAAFSDLSLSLDLSVQEAWVHHNHHVTKVFPHSRNSNREWVLSKEVEGGSPGLCQFDEEGKGEAAGVLEFGSAAPHALFPDWLCLLWGRAMALNSELAEQRRFLLCGVFCHWKGFQAFFLKPLILLDMCRCCCPTPVLYRRPCRDMWQI